MPGNWLLYHGCSLQFLPYGTAAARRLLLTPEQLLTPCCLIAPNSAYLLAALTASFSCLCQLCIGTAGWQKPSLVKTHSFEWLCTDRPVVHLFVLQLSLLSISAVEHWHLSSHVWGIAGKPFSKYLNNLIVKKGRRGILAPCSSLAACVWAGLRVCCSCVASV